MAGRKKQTPRRRLTHAQPQPPRRRLSTRELRSPGAAVARDYLKVDAPVEVYVELDGFGGSDQKRPTKLLRPGDLSKPSKRFYIPDDYFGDEEEDPLAADDAQGEGDDLGLVDDDAILGLLDDAQGEGDDLGLVDDDAILGLLDAAAVPDDHADAAAQGEGEVLYGDEEAAAAESEA